MGGERCATGCASRTTARGRRGSRTDGNVLAWLAVASVLAAAAPAAAIPSPDPSPGIPTVANGSVTNVSFGNTVDSWKYLKVYVYGGATSLTVQMTGPACSVPEACFDIDLTVSGPTGSCSAPVYGNGETCAFSNPGQDWWLIGMYHYSNSPTASGGTVQIRVNHNGVNQPPVVAFTGTPTTVAPGGTVSFDASATTDGDGVRTAYEWNFDGGAVDATVAVPTTSFTYPAPGVYSVTLRVRDDEGAWGTLTRANYITVTDTIPPTVPSNLDASAASSSRIDLSWSPAASDNVAVTALTVFRGTTGLAVPGGDVHALLPSVTQTAYADTTAAASTPYCYYLRAEDAAGNFGYSNVDCATTPAAGDTQPPAFGPGVLTPTPSSPTAIALSWPAATDDSGAVTAIEVHEGPPGFTIGGAGSALVASLPGPAVEHDHVGLAAASQHCYWVRARDAAGNQADLGAAGGVAACAATPAAPDSTPPTVGTLTGTKTDVSVTLTWGAAADPETGLAGIDVYQGGAGLAPPGGTLLAPASAGTATSRVVAGLTPGTPYCFYLVVRNGVTPTPLTATSNVHCDTTLAAADTTPPTVGALAATATGPTTVSLSWGAAADAQSGVSAIRVYRGAAGLVPPAGTLATTTPLGGTATGHDVAGLAPATEACFYVRVDNGVAPTPLSTTSNVACATTPQAPAESQPAPAASAPLVADAGPGQTVPEGAAVQLDGSGADGGRAAGFAWVQVDGPAVALRGTNTPYAGFTAPAIDGDEPASLRFRLTIQDARGNAAADEVTITVTPHGLAAPPGPAADSAAGDGPAPPWVPSLGASADGLRVAFSAGGLPQEATVAWSFGDGSRSTHPDPLHDYAAPGTYTVTLTVTPVAGEPRTVTRTVEVAGAPATLEGAGEDAPTSAASHDGDAPSWRLPAILGGAGVVVVAAAAAAGALLRRRAAPAA